MTKTSRLLPLSAAAAILTLSATALSAPQASAQPWTWLTERCHGDSCATFRCNDGGCTRIAPWRHGGVDAGYFTDRSYDGYVYENGSTRFDRCFDNRCATFRCDSNGDRCTRDGVWRYR